MLCLVVAPVTTWAQGQDYGKPPSTIENLIWSILPIIVIAIFIWLFFIRNIKKMQHGYREEQRQHNRAVLELLERIAKALEKRGGGDA